MWRKKKKTTFPRIETEGSLGRIKYKYFQFPFFFYYKVNWNVDACQSTACSFLIWDVYLWWLEMCHCCIDATFSPDWQHLHSIPHISIFPQAFCCNKRELSSLPLPTMSINAILRYALYLGMSSLSEWHSHNRGLWNLSFCTLHICFLLLDMHQPWCSDSRHKLVSMWGRLCSLRACERLHTQMLSCTSFFFQ